MTHADHRAPPGNRAIWLPVAAVVIGAADWAMTWLLIGETGEGTKEVAGLSEGNLRAIQNPGTLLMIAAITVVRVRFGSRLSDTMRMALAVVFLALNLTLVGNVVEFGIWGDGPFESQDPGAAIFFSGVYILLLGLVLLVVSVAHGLWRHAARRNP